MAGGGGRVTSNILHTGNSLPGQYFETGIIGFVSTVRVQFYIQFVYLDDEMTFNVKERKRPSEFAMNNYLFIDYPFVS